MQGSILLKGTVSLLSSLSTTIELPFCASRYVDYIAWNKVLIIDERVSHYSITIFLGWLQVRPCIWSLKYCDHIIPNQRSVCNKLVCEWSNSFNVTSRHRRYTEDWSTRNHLLIICEIIATISAMCGITCSGWKLQIIPQPIIEGLSIYSLKSSDVLYHHFQSIDLVLWVDGRYNFWVLVSFLHVLMIVNRADCD